eukprot:scaffold3973_cov21-Prasinocladus_malaysianus.AAC.1
MVCQPLLLGGQVLMTHDAWNIVRTNMAKASYPVVQQIGLFKFEAVQSPMWVYEVSLSTVDHAQDRALLNAFLCRDCVHIKRSEPCHQVAEMGSVGRGSLVLVQV